MGKLTPSTPAPRSRFIILKESSRGFQHRRMTKHSPAIKMGDCFASLAMTTIKLTSRNHRNLTAKGFDLQKCRQTSCRPTIIGLIIIALICFLPSIVIAQTETKIIGQVIDQISGSPVPGAVITIQGQGRNTVSDAQGRFYFNDLPSGNYGLAAERIGFENLSPQTVNVDEISATQIMLRMKPKVIEVPGQTVMAPKSYPLTIQSKGNITEIDMIPGKLESIESLAEQVPELEVVDSGARKLLRIRGAQLNGTTVMLDGRVINSTLTSEGDVSAIPLKSVAKIEIIKGGSYKSEGLAGSINFITDSDHEDNMVSSSGERGSFGLESYAVRFAEKRPDGIAAGIDLAESYSRGNFRFTDPRNSVETRNNNFTHDLNLFGTLGLSRETIQINLKGRYFKRDGGVPGPIFQYTPEATSNSIEKEIYSTLKKQFGSRWGVNATAGITSRDAKYDSPQTNTNFINYKTDFKEDSRDLEMQLIRKGRIDFDSYFSLRYESMDGADLIRPSYSFGRHSRLVNTTAVGSVLNLPHLINLNKQSSLTLGIKRYGGHGGDFWAPSGSIRVNFNLPFNPGIDASAFRSRRLPDLTDLYWKEDVFATPNADLKPEKSLGYDMGFDLHIESHGDYRIRASRYETKYDDIIIWRRWAGDKFKPVNLSKASISGWEFSINTIPLVGPVTIFWNASFIRPMNMEPEPTHHDKYLTFRPIGSQNAGLEFNYRSWNLKFSGRHIGRRYVTEENTKSLQPVDLLDFYAAYQIGIWSFSLMPSFSILNIGNIQYEILDGQPEKPREYRVKVELSRNGGIF
jgi:outer membrane cobalamin receptor